MVADKIAEETVVMCCLLANCIRQLEVFSKDTPCTVLWYNKVALRCKWHHVWFHTSWVPIFPGIWKPGSQYYENGDKMSCVHVVLFCNLIGTDRARRRKSTAFPSDVTRLSPPTFLKRELGNKARIIVGLIGRGCPYSHEFDYQ